jgi:hypothetical protein
MTSILNGKKLSEKLKPPSPTIKLQLCWTYVLSKILLCPILYWALNTSSVQQGQIFFD